MVVAFHLWKLKKNWFLLTNPCFVSCHRRKLHVCSGFLVDVVSVVVVEGRHLHVVVCWPLEKELLCAVDLPDICSVDALAAYQSEHLDLRIHLAEVLVATTSWDTGQEEHGECKFTCQHRQLDSLYWQPGMVFAGSLKANCSMEHWCLVYTFLVEAAVVVEDILDC